MADAAALRAGRASIELSLEQKLLDRHLARMRAQILRGFRHLGAQMAGLKMPNMAAAIAPPAATSRLWSAMALSMGTMRAHASRLRNSLANINSFRFPGLLSIRGLFIGAGIGAVLTWPVKLAAGIELSSEQMAVFTGSTELARDKIIELQKFSAVAFQDVENLTTQMRLLMTRGIKADDAMDDIKALTVLAAGSTEEFQQLTKAFADVASATRLNGEEMRQFKNTAFNPYVEIMKRTGETMDDVKNRMEAGGVSFEEVRMALHASVREGGLFHGMLAKISKTLAGQVKMAFANFKVAILPLGDEMLAPLKTFMGGVNRMMPKFSEWIEKNKSTMKSLLGVLSGVTALTLAFVTIGLASQIFAVAISGVGMALGLVTATVGAIAAAFALVFSPIGILVMLIAAVTRAFILMTETGRTMANAIANWFTQLKEIMVIAWGGIVDALKAGDLALAGEIAMTALHAAIFIGLKPIANVFDSFVRGMVRVFGTGITSIISMWQSATKKIANWLLQDAAEGGLLGTAALLGTGVDIQTEQGRAQMQRQKELMLLRKQLDDWREIQAAFAEGGSTWEEAKEKFNLFWDLDEAGIDQAIAGLESRLGELGSKPVDVLGDMQRDAERQLDDLTESVFDFLDDPDMGERTAEKIEDLKAKLEDLREKAKKAADEVSPDKEWFGAKKFKDLVAGGLKKAEAAAISPQATFDPRLARQMFGGNPIEQQQLDELRRIEKNTKRGGGIPVV